MVTLISVRIWTLNQLVIEFKTYGDLCFKLDGMSGRSGPLRWQVVAKSNISLN